jgi:hypothetical protein
MGLVAHSLLAFGLSWLHCAPALAEDLRARLGKMEQLVFNKENPDAPIAARLQSLDVSVFGAQQDGTVIQRLDALERFLIVPSAKSSDENKPASSVRAQSDPDELQDKGPLMDGTPASKGRILNGGVQGQGFDTDSTRIEESAGKQFCGRWSGLLSGNDRNVQVVLDLQCSGNQLRGAFQWTSWRSGTNTRALSGYYDPNSGEVILKDDGLLSASPRGNWRFCPIDRYELRLGANGEQLAGRFWSATCSDRGTFDVHRIPDR